MFSLCGGWGGRGGPFIVVVWLVSFLGLLAREGALGAFKWGRDWCVMEGDLERYVGCMGEGRRKLVGLWCSVWWTGVRARKAVMRHAVHYFHYIVSVKR